LAVGRIGSEAAVAGVAEVAAFDEDAGDFRVAGEAQVARCKRVARPWLSTRQK
jgi:hypothetical protein